jgi:glycosyltransferase involved in cell wall biosynthesis
MLKKRKILLLSDHALSTSGVGCQSRFLMNGLIEKGGWTVRQFGAAMKHTSYETVIVNDDFIIKPIDGFGDRDLLIQTLAIEKPDLLFIFTDPRFFIWLFEIEDEIRNVCPIAYWHVWDNYPAPTFNQPLYESCDLINCHSHLTYEIVSGMTATNKEKTHFIPHSLPEDIFYPLEKTAIDDFKIQALGPERKDDFVLFWVNRNARRKRPNDLLWAWSLFVKELKEKHGKSNATLLLHTDPNDNEGPNLLVTAEKLRIVDSIVFSSDRVDFEKMNVLHNISDACINIAYAEGFGLSTLEAMQCGNPIIALKTGGLTRQVVDHRDGSENGMALDVDFQSLVGSQGVPFIYEDYCSAQKTADAIMKLYEMPKSKQKKLGRKAREYVLSEFNHQKMIDQWDASLTALIDSWKEKRGQRWVLEEVTR